jgi:predicted CXXCH cytochrome family protein
MRNRTTNATGALVLIAATLALAACREIVYRDRPLFDEPIAAAGGFLGYANAEQRLTVCGQCHVSFQRRWQQTAHASAWHTLQSSPGVQAVCSGCHTTSALGNHVQGNVGGYFGQADSRYHDVQCESCHGPGLEHVRAPTRDNWPLASIAVGADPGGGCGECHTGVHRPFLEQWTSSRHSTVRAGPAGNPACNSCHRAQAALESWGVRAEYREKRQPQHFAITCAVCHDPHDTTNPHQLRLPIDVPSEERNLCMQCHHKRGTPDPTTFRGPHSPEGPVLLGFGGWWPPNMELRPGEVIATHGSEANPRLCAGCHVNRYEMRDPLTDRFVFQSTGHTFEAIPCVDARGVPTGSRTCGLAERSLRTCTGAGCHGSEGVARTLVTVVRDRLHTLAAGLQTMEAQIPPGEFDDRDNRYTTAEGARFNRQLAQFRGSEIHNPWLIEALLRASIRQVQRDYGIAPPTGLNLEQELGVR